MSLVTDRSPSDSSPTALVTGSAVRIGRAVAVDLGQRGWQVVVHYRSSESGAEAAVAEIVSAGGRAIAVSAALGDPRRAAETLFEAAERAAPHADKRCLLACAAEAEACRVTCGKPRISVAASRGAES